MLIEPVGALPTQVASRSLIAQTAVTGMVGADSSERLRRAKKPRSEAQREPGADVIGADDGHEGEAYGLIGLIGRPTCK